MNPESADESVNHGVPAKSSTGGTSGGVSPGSLINYGIAKRLMGVGAGRENRETQIMQRPGNNLTGLKLNSQGPKTSTAAALRMWRPLDQQEMNATEEAVQHQGKYQAQ